MPDSSFEIAFSDLAHASLSEKAPGLMEYLVGFQILDKNDEETHAVAVFGFKVGNQWFYAPVFFLNGSLKGMELLYVKNQDLFVPLQDNWVNYLVSKRPRSIGQAEQVPEKDLRLEAPDFRVFSDSPGTAGTKWASAISVSAMKAWARPFLPAYGRLINDFCKEAEEARRLDLREVLRRAPELAPCLADTMRGNMKFAEAVLGFYDLKELLPGPEQVKRALLDLRPKTRKSLTEVKTIKLPASAPAVGDDKSDLPGTSGQKVSGVLEEVLGRSKKAELVGNYHKWGYDRHYNSTQEVLDSLVGCERQKKASEYDQIKRDANSPDVEVFTQEDVPSVLAGGGNAPLTDKEKEQLQAGEVVVRDHRDSTSRVYEAEFDRHITNPVESGIYDVLTSLGSFTKCLVLNSPKTIGAGRTSNVCTVVELNGRHCGNFRNIDVLVHRQEQGVSSFQDRFQKVYEGAKELSAMKSGWIYVLIGPNGEGTIPFKYLTQADRNDGTTVYAVCLQTSVTRGKNSVRSTLGADSCFGGDGITIENFDSPVMSVAPGDETAKKRPYTEWELQESRQIVVSDRAGPSRLKNIGGCAFVPQTWKALEIGAATNNSLEDEKDQAQRLDPGCLLDAETYVLKLGARDLTVRKDGPQYVVSHEGGQQRLQKQAAVRHLVVDWRLRAEDAKELVKRAETQRCVQCFIKLAQGLDAPPNGPFFPPYATRMNDMLGVPMQEQQTDFMNVPGMLPDPNNRFSYKLMEDPEVRNALAAADRGQKDVFDTSVVTGLIKAVDVDSMVDSFLPDMIKGMDRIGRVLFLFYWHNDSFRDRYGRQDLVTLEDSLKNVFKSSGDLVLFLKQKTIEAEPMMDAIDIDLDASAGS